MRDEPSCNLIFESELTSCLLVELGLIIRLLVDALGLWKPELLCVQLEVLLEGRCKVILHLCSVIWPCFELSRNRL